jgi:hypothetical protein
MSATLTQATITANHRANGAAASARLGDGLMHAGAGGGLALIQLSAIIPGLLPCLALLGVVGVVVALPVAVLALATALLLGPPYGLWRLAMRGRRDGRAGPSHTTPNRHLFTTREEHHESS